MKKKNTIKLALDLVMLLVLLLLYRKNVLGISFHEIAGLAVCGLFIVHILLNGKWVLVVTGKLFSKKAAWRSKLNWLIDFLLLLSFAYILVSGISISKVLFAGQRGASAFKTGHYAVSALALVLLGIHLGLHYSSILQRTPARKLPLTFRRVTAVVLSALILGFGVYEMTHTSFLRWMGNLGAVIGTTEAASAFESGEFSSTLPEDLQAQDSEAVPTEGEAALAEGEEGGHGNGPGNGGGNGTGNGKGAETTVDASQIPDVLLSFLSITLSFAAVVAWIDGIAMYRRRKKRLPNAAAA